MHFFRNNPPRFALALLFGLLVGCGANVKMNHASRDVLKRYHHVAVVDVKIDMVEEGLLKEAVGLARKELGDKDAVGNSKNEIEEYTIDNINRNLLQKGFIPLQRGRIKSVLKEQQLAASGLTVDSTRLGALLQADAVFHGSIIVKKKAGFEFPFIVGCLFPPLFLIRGGEAEILFSGTMTSVEGGFIILSGTSATTADRFSLQDVDSLVNAGLRRCLRCYDSISASDHCSATRA